MKLVQGQDSISLPNITCVLYSSHGCICPVPEPPEQVDPAQLERGVEAVLQTEGDLDQLPRPDLGLELVIRLV